jgi:hypothetical protein
MQRLQIPGSDERNGRESNLAAFAQERQRIYAQAGTGAVSTWLARSA